MLEYDYDYDLEKRPFISRKIDCTKPVGQCFLIPKGVACITGFQVKLSKIGSPGRIEYRIGSSFGASDIIRGYINEESITPFYEMFQGDSFSPCKVLADKQYFLWLKPESGLIPYDGYRIYGPHPGEKYGYKDDLIDMAHWQNAASNVSYPKYVCQEGLPQYEGGFGLDEKGERTWSISFKIFSSDENTVDIKEERFKCIQRLTSKVNYEWRNIRQDRQPDFDEIEINGDWFIDYSFNSNVVLNAVTDFKNFCESCMGFLPDGGKKCIKLTIDSGLSFDEEQSRVTVHSMGIDILSRGERGLMRAIFLLEDIMRFKKVPFLKLGTLEYKPLYSLRMTKGIYSDPYQYFELEEPDIYTEGYLKRISRGGYNAIWLLLNIEQLVADSSVFPEMNDEKARLVIRRLKELTERAENFGIDVYFEIRTWHYKPFESSLYDKYPGLKSYEQWNTAFNSPCSGSQLVLKFYQETLVNVFENVPKLKGMLMIYDTEGFYTCFMRGQNIKCGQCREKDSIELAGSFMKMLSDAVKTGREDRKLVLWTYATQGDWSIKVLKDCKGLENLVIMGCINQFSDIERMGVKSKVEDYAVCVSGASEYFSKLSKLSERLNKPIIAKIEDAYGQEFVSTPYMFTLHQFQKKWEVFHKFKCWGFMANYSHYGFFPGPCADLMKLNCFTVTGDNQFDSTDKIRIAIIQNYGNEVNKYLETASQCFSTAMSSFFPYSPGVCRYPGPIQSAPSQPFYLDTERKVKRQRARGNVKDLNWTLHKGWDFRDLKDIEAWNDRLVCKCFESFNEKYREGISYLKYALKLIDTVYLPALLELIDIAETHVICVETMINFIYFANLREQYETDCSRDLGKSIGFLLEKELTNTAEILRICCGNSAIGLTGSGNGNVRGGLFNPYTIREKIMELKEEIGKL